MTASTPRPHVSYAKSGAVAVVTIDRPEKRNAIALQTAAEICDAIAKAESDSDVRALVVTGAGQKAFASGADLDEIGGAMNSPESALAYDGRLNNLYKALRQSRLPTIARIQGHAIGGGFLLALACDLRVASDRATLSLPVSRIGLMLSPEEHRMLVAQVGPSRAKLLLYTGRRLSAEAAFAWGLVDLVATDGTLDESVEELTEEIASGAPLALAAAKQLVNTAPYDATHAATVGECYRDIYTSEDLKEGLAAIAERRAPDFRGR